MQVKFPQENQNERQTVSLICQHKFYKNAWCVCMWALYVINSLLHFQMPALEPDFTSIKMTNLSLRAFLSENKNKPKALFLPWTNQTLISIQAMNITSALANLADSDLPYKSYHTHQSGHYSLIHPNVVPHSWSTNMRNSKDFLWFSMQLKCKNSSKNWHKSTIKLVFK